MRARERRSRDVTSVERHGPTAPSLPGFVQLQRAAGNAAVSALVAQRNLFEVPPKGRRQQRSWADVAEDPAVKAADDLIKKLIELIASSKGVHISYSDCQELVGEAEASASDPSANLVKLADGPTLTLWRAWLVRKEIRSTNAYDLIAERQRTLANRPFTADVRILGPNPRVRVPTTEARMRAANPTGRNDAKFVRVDNNLEELPQATIGAAALVLAKQQKKIGNLRQVGPENKAVSVCPTCGDVMDAQLFETDHQDPVAKILDRLWRLAGQMSEDRGFYREVRAQLGEKKFQMYFTVSDKGKNPTTKPTRYVVGALSNDVQNLLWICRKCNGATGKSDKSIMDWYQRNPLFGSEFIETYLDRSGTEGVMFRARENRGWGAVAVEWFTEKHWPALQKLIPTEEHKEVLRKTLIEESRLGVKASAARRQSEQGRLLNQKEQLGRHNDLTVLTTEALTKFHSRPTPQEIGPNSPEQTAELVHDVLVTREKGRRGRRMEESKPYRRGLLQGYAGQKDLSGTLTDSAAEQYAEGYRRGAKDAADDRARGRLDGIAGRRTVPSGDKDPYDVGFDEGLAEIEAITDRGESAGKDGADLDAGVAPDAPGAAYLMQAYMRGYNVGRKGRKGKTNKNG